MLSRQCTDYVDVLVLGDLMTATEDYTPLLEQIAPLLSAGKTRGWAVNNWSAAEVASLVRQAQRCGVPGPEFAQLKYGLARRSVAEGEPYRTLCEQEGVRIQASEPFEGGLIFGPRADHGQPGRLIGDVCGGAALISPVGASPPPPVRGTPHRGRRPGRAGSCSW